MAGEIVHIEFASQDADRAAAFWGGLFGWEFADSGMPGMDYRMARTGPESGAAVYASKEPGSGHPIYYYGCDDIAASRARIVELGGTADERSPVPGHGWLAACVDSEGNAFRLWQADDQAG